jgi:uncharacterized protein DUF6600
MVHALKKKAKRLTIAASLCGLFVLGAFAQQDPSYRVARLNYVHGNVSMEPAGVDDWVPAETNRPFTTGDYLYTDDGAQAELHLDVAVMRMGPQTSFGFLNLDDQTVQIKLSEGEMHFRIRNFGQNQVFEVDTPNAAVTFVQNGSYVVSVDPNGNTSFLTVREGQAQVTGSGQSFTVDQGSTVNLSGTDELGYDVQDASQPDQFEDWSYQRDQHEVQNNRSSRYLPPAVIGYEDLDDYGDWRSSGEYGNVWYPRQVDSGWAPYHNGHWAWIDPWGYTWVDDAPWGFAPFHYGRWAYISNRWGWCPGPIGIGYGGPGYGYGRPVVRPYYAPALVAFFGGSHFGVSIGIGGGGDSLGWVPLGYGEVYTPPYAVSQNYFREVNVSNTRITNVTNITNVYNNTYVNHNGYNQSYVNARAPGAVMAVPQSAFASGRSVRQIGRPVPVSAVSRLQSAAILGPRVVPTRQAFVPTAGRGPAPRPSAQVLQRQVVARRPPPPPPVPVAEKQAYLQRNAGRPNQPYNHAAMRQAVAPARTTPVAAVRQVSAPAAAARPVVVRPGQRGGNVAALPAGRPGQPASSVRPGQPATATRPGQPSPEARPGQPTAGRPAPETRQPAAGRGTPPNIRQEQPSGFDDGRGASPANAARPAPTARPGERTPAPRPEDRPNQPAPPRGTPPNMRQSYPAQPGTRPRERTRPSSQPEDRVAQPAGRPEPRPESRPVEPVRPATRPAPEARPAPQHGNPPERRQTQPAPEARTFRPEARPVPEARPARPDPRVAAEVRAPQPQPRPTPDVRAPRPETRPAPIERQQMRPAPEARQGPAERPQARPAPEPRQAPQHGTPPNRGDRSNRDTREPR